MINKNNHNIELIEKRDVANILAIISNKYNREIITSLNKFPKNVFDLSIDSKVPLGSIKRHLDKLYENKLVNYLVINKNGKKTRIYNSNMKKIQILFDGETLKIISSKVQDKK